MTKLEEIAYVAYHYPNTAVCLVIAGVLIGITVFVLMFSLFKILWYLRNMCETLAKKLSQVILVWARKPS